MFINKNRNIKIMNNKKSLNQKSINLISRYIEKEISVKIEQNLI